MASRHWMDNSIHWRGAIRVRILSRIARRNDRSSHMHMCIYRQHMQLRMRFNNA